MKLRVVLIVTLLLSFAAPLTVQGTVVEVASRRGLGSHRPRWCPAASVA
jgi:hypothetical protein